MTQSNCIKCLFLLTLVLAISGSQVSLAQDIQLKKTFRVKLKAGDTLRFEHDSVFTYHKDTVLQIPRNISYGHSAPPKKKNAAFFDSLKVKYGHKKLTEHLIDALIVDKDTTTARQRAIDEFMASEALFQPYEGMIIKNIRIKKVPIMSGSVNDTTFNNASWATEVANKLHADTKNRVIRNNLLFKIGEQISAYTMADNERLIRALRFIEDAKIMVHKIPGTKFAEVVVVTKDVWSVGASIDVSSTDEFNIEVYDRNLYGLGYELSNTALVNTNESPRIGYNGQYIMNNIKGTFINGLAQYRHTYKEELSRFRLDRQFFTPQTKYAGGLEVQKRSDLVDIDPRSDETLITRATFRQQDAWIGKSINLQEENRRKNVLLSIAALNRVYVDRPFISADSNFSYHDTRLYLAKIAYAKRNYYRGNFVNRFGITEDIPVGEFYAVTFGKEFGSFKDRFYQQFSYFKSYVLEREAYLTGSASISWYRIEDRTEDGVLQLEGNYFSELKEIAARYQVRFNTKLTYTKGFKRVDDQHLRLTDRFGIRGLDEVDINGSERLSLQLEADLITRWELIGFRFFPYVFTDIGLINYSKATLVHGQNIYNGIGAGLRIRNESLVFSTFEIRFAYYPRTDLSSPTGIDFFSRSPSIFRDFNEAKPQIVRFE